MTPVEDEWQPLLTEQVRDPEFRDACDVAERDERLAHPHARHRRPAAELSPRTRKLIYGAFWLGLLIIVIALVTWWWA